MAFHRTSTWPVRRLDRWGSSEPPIWPRPRQRPQVLARTVDWSGVNEVSPRPAQEGSFVQPGGHPLDLDDYLAVLEYSSDALVGVDADQKVRIWNAAAEQMFGYSAADMRGRSLSRLLPAQVRGDHAELVRSYESSDSDRRSMGAGGDLTAVRSSGEEFAVHVLLAKIPLRDGALTLASVRDVSIRVEAEKERQRQRDWLHSLVSNSFDVVSVFDAHGTVTSVEPMDEGFSSDELLGLRLDEWCHIDDVDAVREALGEVLRQGENAVVEVTHRCHFPDGYRWMESRFKNLMGNAAVGGIVANGRDVTDRMEAANAQRAQQEWSDALVSNGFDAISVLDEGGFIKHIQPIPGGRPHDDLIGRHHNTWIHPDDVASVDDAISEMLEKGIGTTAEVTCRADFGDGYRWIEQRFTNLLENEAIAGIIANLRDVTERVEADDERRKQQAWFEALVSNSFDTAGVLDVHGVITYMQPLADGYRSDQMLGRKQREFIHPDDLRAWDETFAALVRQGIGASAEVTFRADFPEGYRWFEVRLRNLLDDVTIGGIAVNGRDVTERRNAELRLEHQATHDVLTGLPNRAVLLDRVDHALARTARNGGLIAVLFMDLDGFKAVNDSGGHEAGDQLLVGVARRLGAVVRDSDTLARQGGDEFVVLIEDIVGSDGALVQAERVREALRDPVRVGDSLIHLTASIGIAIAVDGDQTATGLLGNADVAMYQAKSAGRDRIEMFDRSMRDVIELKRRTELELRGAIERDEMRVHYQPIVHARSGELCGTEALVRWDHPGRGWLGPNEFIPIAEETDFITAIDSWVLDTACRQVMAWDENAGIRLNINVNLSARQLVDPDLATRVEQTLRSIGIESGRVCLELTETAIINHPVLAAATLHDLHDLGVHIALDDFGTGYSSLAHLRNLPLTSIKIDRSFTAGLGSNTKNTTIIRSTIALAHDLGLSVVAEGVETADQLALLQGFGCDLVQGLYFGAAGAPEAIEKLLQSSDALLRPVASHRTVSTSSS